MTGSTAGDLKKTEGVGFQLPTSEDQKIAMENTTKVGENIFVVLSMTEEGKNLVV